MKAVRGITLAAAAFFLVTGIWAFAAPKNFYDVVATYPPYNEHLFHDAGAFQIGLGVTAAAALLWRDALRVALAGLAAGAAVHAVSHVIDRDLGGRSTDPWTLSVFAVLLLVALGLVLRRQEQE